MRCNEADIMDIIDNLRRVFQAITEYSKQAVTQTGLTAPQLWALKILGGNAPINVSELARRMCLHPATVVGILDRLEGKGLAERIRSSEDRRVVVLHPTEAGIKLVADAPEVAQSLLMRGLAELSGEQLRCVEDGMRLVVRVLNAEQIKPQPMQGASPNQWAHGEH